MNAGRILGVDPGEKRVGLALSDPLKITAQGLPTLRVTSPADAVRQITDVVRRSDVGMIVVGLPLNMDGSEGEQARRAQYLGKQLEEELRLPVLFRDERLSSLQAEKVLLEGDVSRQQRKKEIDRLAAQIILQSYLDEDRRENEESGIEETT